MQCVFFGMISDIKYNKDATKPKKFYFYSDHQLDSLYYMEIASGKLIREYRKRADRCRFQKFEYKLGNVLKVNKLK